MTDVRYDAVVVGGGPGGSAAATVLAQARRRVLLLEKERFPRFHVGESLLPYHRRLFDRLGLRSRLEAAGFVDKYGAQFHSGSDCHHATFVFGQGFFTREPAAYQVERSTFDHLLLQHAREAGVDAREGWTVCHTEAAPTHRRVHATDPAGRAHGFDAAFVVDASGRTNLTGNLERLRVPHPRLRKLALFSHFTGVRLDSGPRAGDTVILRMPDRWFWLIPLSPAKVSVGLVVDTAVLQASGVTPAELFEREWRQWPAARKRLEQATALRPIEVASDFSYLNRRLVSSRLLRVGDAAGFVDPIFSAGVYLAMLSGIRAGEAVDRALASGSDGGRELARYERDTRRSIRTYSRMSEGFYRAPFMELIFAPSERLRLASAVNAVLAGELAGGWALRWRLCAFFLLVGLQARLAVVPRSDLR